ncbi:alpha-mannosidase [Acidilobus saccharovorans]|uniref:alpha-mannosidase n=1 Tax=Acidilobus saccharovorans TaxID=242703 RepID=UPI0011D15A41|nr:glycoside hydrolase family 38 C-terminal domain-containing protein [Acidilobus saccharovorans]
MEKLTPQAIAHRVLLVLASSFREVRPVPWSREGTTLYSYRYSSESPKDLYMVVTAHSVPALVRLDGRPYYEIDREHHQVPLPRGQHTVTAELTIYDDFGEPALKMGRPLGPPRAYTALRDPEGYALFLYASSALEVAQSTRDQQLRDDLLSLLSRSLSLVRVPSISPAQLEIASTLYRTSYDAGRVLVSLDESLSSVYVEPEGVQFSEALRVLREGLKDLVERHGKPGVAHVVGHAHIDAAWLWPFSETRRKVLRTTATVLTLMDQFRDMKYVQSSSLYYEWLQQDAPELIERIAQLIKEGRWELGAGYIEFDPNVTSGESMARQLLYSQRFFERAFGRRAEVLWLPDSFGYQATLAQIARLSGVKYFATHKLTWNDTNQFPYGPFLWDGGDGVPIPSVVFGFGGRGYNSPLTASSVLEQWDRWPTKEYPTLISYGYGDGGGGPTEDMELLFDVINEMPGLPRLVHSRPSEYFNYIEVSSLDRWRGRLYVETHRGTYTSHSAMKALHFDAERWMRELEAWSALANAYDRSEAQSLWKVIMKDEFHDVLPGSAIREVYDEVYRELQDVIDKARAEAAKAMSLLAGGSGNAVFNSLPWPRAGYVVVNSPVDGAQRVDEGYLAFVKVPPMGYSSLRPADPGDSVSARTEGDKVILEGSRLRVVIERDGTISSILLKDSGHEFVSGRANELAVYQNSPGWADAWDIEPGYRLGEVKLKADSVTVKESGPLRASAAITYSFGRSSVTEEVRLYAGLPLVEFKVTIDAVDREQMLKAWHSFNVNNDYYAYGAPLGVLEEPARRNNSWERAMFEVPFQKFIDVYDSSRGAAILSPKKYGASVMDNRVGLTLLRTPVFPDPATDLGRQEFTYAIYVHPGDWRSANVPRVAYEYAFQLTVGPGSGEGSFMELSPSNLVLEAVKVPEDGDGIVVRVFEAHNSSGVGVLRAPFRVGEARSVNILEEDEVPRELSVEGDLVRFSYRPREIITLLLRPAR